MGDYLELRVTKKFSRMTFKESDNKTISRSLLIVARNEALEYADCIDAALDMALKHCL